MTEVISRCHDVALCARATQERVDLCGASDVSIDARLPVVVVRLAFAICMDEMIKVWSQCKAI